MEIEKLPKLNPKGEPWKYVVPTTESISEFFETLRNGWERDIITIRQGTQSLVSDSVARSYIQKHPFKTVEELIKLIDNEHPRPNTI